MLDRPLIGVSVAVRRDNKVLLQKRITKHGFGTWAFAGGHFEKWETFEECALRELKEEAGSEIKVTTPVFWTVSNTRFYDEGKHYVVLFMISDWISGKAQIAEPDKCECWEWRSWDNLPSPLMMGLQNIVDRKLSPFEDTQYKEKMLRAYAELENYRKRVIHESSYAEMPLLSDLLPVLDNVKRAIDAANKSPENIIEGLSMIGRQIDALLHQHGCKPIDVVSAPYFNPHYHQAVMLQDNNEVPVNTILQEVQTGYQLHDRIVRPAKVIVSKKDDKYE